MKKGLILAALAFASISAANATQIKFFTGGGASASVNGSTFVTPTTPISITGDYVGSTLVYNLGAGLTLTVSASGSGSSAVVQDAYPSQGGLGDNGAQNGDNTGSGEFVTLQFNQSVFLAGFFAFWDHVAPIGSNSVVNLNGTDFNSNGNDWISVNSQQSTFTFGKVEDGFRDADLGFYVSALQYEVPEPATMGLFGLGLAAVGFVRRRRIAA